MRRKALALLTTTVAATALVSCGAGGMNGTYEKIVTGEEMGLDQEIIEEIYNDPHGFDTTFKLALDGDGCDLTMKGPMIGDNQMDCEIDEDAGVIRVVGDQATGDPKQDEIPFTYNDEDDTVTIHTGTEDQANDVILEKVEG